jgi:type II secretory pathway component PulM
VTGAAAIFSTPRAWDRASARERVALVVGAAIIVGALAWAFVWQPLTRDLDRLRESAPGDAASLARARALADDIAGLARASVPPQADLRTAVERSLGDRGLRAPALTIEPQDGRVKVVIPVVPFATLVTALEAARKDAAAYVAEATITPRVDPGTVRAELVLAR